MKNVQVAALLFVAVAMVGAQDFRSSYWGDSRQRVIEAEGRPDLAVQQFLYRQEQVNIVFDFNRAGQLIGGYYFYGQDDWTWEQHVDFWNTNLAALVEEHGKGNVNEGEDHERMWLTPTGTIIHYYLKRKVGTFTDKNKVTINHILKYVTVRTKHGQLLFSVYKKWQ